MAEFAHGEHSEDDEKLRRTPGSPAVDVMDAPASSPAPVGGLLVGSADDPLEAAADRAADAALSRIRRMAVPAGAPPAAHQHGRGCGHLDVHRLATPSSAPDIGMEGGALDGGTNAKINSMRSSGKPLENGLRATMESAFGAPLDRLRIHTGSEAATISRQISAKAFTTGNDIFFGEGQFRPDSPAGAHTLAHEIAHTLQPTDSVSRMLIQRDPTATMSKSARKRAAKKKRKAFAGVVLHTPDEPIEGEEPAPQLVEGPKAPAEIPPQPEVAKAPEVVADAPEAEVEQEVVAEPVQVAKHYDDIIDNALAGKPPFRGYWGGNQFFNDRGRLPRWDDDGWIYYQEWDIYPKRRGVDRGAERIVTGTDGSAWYTGDHYRSFSRER